MCLLAHRSVPSNSLLSSHRSMEGVWHACNQQCGRVQDTASASPSPYCCPTAKGGGGGQQLEVMLPCPSCHLPSHPSLSLLDFDSVTIPGLKQPLCKVRHHTSRWRFLLRGSLVIGVSLYRYKTSRGRAPARTPLTLRCCTAIPVPSPPVPALGPGEVTAHSVLGVPSQPWGDTGSKEPQ